MDEIKIAFFDVDGTLIDLGRKEITPKTLEALKAAADDICGHVAEDGIYHYCLAHGFL